MIYELRMCDSSGYPRRMCLEEQMRDPDLAQFEPFFMHIFIDRIWPPRHHNVPPQQD
jgi:hypothetical protein